MAVHPAPVPPRRSGGIRRIALFARFPRWLRRLSGRPADDLTLLVDDDGTFLDVARAGALYPALADRIVELQAVLVPLFRECDAEAAVEQNRYRRQQVTLIIGGFLTATLGAVQAAVGKQAWPGIAV